MLLNEITTAGAIPSLEAMTQFTARRAAVLAHNVANATTPNFQPRDVSPAEFQQMLAKATDKRRARTGSAFGQLELKDTNQIKVRKDGSLCLNPETPSGNILFHDRNDRDMERQIQSIVENHASFQLATTLLRQQFDHLRAAIRLQP